MPQILFQKLSTMSIDKVVGKALFNKLKLYLIIWKPHLKRQMSWECRFKFSHHKFFKRFDQSKDIKTLPWVEQEYIQQGLVLLEQCKTNLTQLNIRKNRRLENVVGKAIINGEIFYFAKWKNIPIFQSDWIDHRGICKLYPMQKYLDQYKGKLFFINNRIIQEYLIEASTQILKDQYLKKQKQDQSQKKMLFVELQKLITKFITRLYKPYDNTHQEFNEINQKFQPLLPKNERLKASNIMNKIQETFHTFENTQKFKQKLQQKNSCKEKKSAKSQLKQENRIVKEQPKQNSYISPDNMTYIPQIQQNKNKSHQLLQVLKNIKDEIDIILNNNQYKIQNSLSKQTRLRSKTRQQKEKYEPSQFQNYIQLSQILSKLMIQNLKPFQKEKNQQTQVKKETDQNQRKEKNNFHKSRFSSKKQHKKIYRRQ